ncbi:uncharacterized protein LOC133922330 [Phragmites australis]|uniref:uncharacterized protein LOC133922330 n=1 Tax=Phragmites australis TaxID=29695 RepID=UPI002D76C249|nr:uncharacterized protein LOC133922330 [Phragmites australis]
MARPSATAAFLLLLSLVAVAHCRALEADPATDASAAESTPVLKVGDETGPPNSFPAEADAIKILGLPSHRHHPCRRGLFHRHLWWARHHGIFRDAHRFHGHGFPSKLVHDREPTEAETEEVKPVAEPDPDHSLQDSDGEGELTSWKPFRGSYVDEEAVAEPWKKEMLWWMFRHALRHHHGLHHRYDDDEDHKHEEEGAEGMKRFHHHDHEEDEEKDEKKTMRMLFHHHHDEKGEEKETRKRFHHSEHDDSDDEDEEVEELVRRFRKAVMRRRSRHGRRFHHHGHHEEDGEEGGVMAWIKGLMNRF